MEAIHAVSVDQLQLIQLIRDQVQSQRLYRLDQLHVYLMSNHRVCIASTSSTCIVRELDTSSWWRRYTLYRSTSSVSVDQLRIDSTSSTCTADLLRFWL